MSKFINEFKEFAVKGNAVDMAVGVIIGGAFGKIVSSIVDDIIMPPIGWLIGGVNFADLKFTLPSVDIEKSYIYNKVKKYIFLFFFYSSNSIRLYNDICLAVFYFLSFSRSRISASSFSSLEGSGAGAGFCSASTLFLRAKRFMPLTSMKTQKAMMMKSKSVWMKLP